MNLAIMLNLLSTRRQLRKHEQWTRPQLEAYQAESLRRLRAYAYAHSPFYQQFHKGLADRPLHELPILTKAMMMEHFDEFVTDRAIHRADVEAHVQRIQDDERFLGRYWVNTTSGSTGRPGLFLFDRAEWTAILASFARAHELAGLKISLTHRMKMAFIASTGPTHMSARAGATLKSWWTIAASGRERASRSDSPAPQRLATGDIGVVCFHDADFGRRAVRRASPHSPARRLY